MPLSALREVDEYVDAAGVGLEEEDQLGAVRPQDGGTLFLPGDVLANEADR